MNRAKWVTTGCKGRARGREEMKTERKLSERGTVAVMDILVVISEGQKLEIQNVLSSH